MNAGCDWNPELSVALPHLTDATLAQLPGLPGERHLVEYLRLVQGLRLNTVAVGTVREPGAWKQVESLWNAVQSVSGEAAPVLQFNLEYLAWDVPRGLQGQGLAWRVVGRGSQPDPALQWLCQAGSDVTVVLPDAVDMDPVELSRWMRAAQGWGATRVELVGKHGRPWTTGVENLVKFCQALRSASTLQLTWSSYDSFGLGLAQAISANEAGAEGIRAGFLGGHGTVPLESLLVHLVMEGMLQADLTGLVSVCNWLQEELEFEVDPTLPILGGDAFRSAGSSVAAAICRKEDGGQLAEALCSAVPAQLLGRNLQMEVGPLSGNANVRHWLRRKGLQAPPHIVQGILEHASQQAQVLSELELIDLYHHLNESA